MSQAKTHKHALVTLVDEPLSLKIEIERIREKD